MKLLRNEFVRFFAFGFAAGTVLVFGAIGGVAAAAPLHAVVAL